MARKVTLSQRVLPRARNRMREIAAISLGVLVVFSSPDLGRADVGHGDGDDDRRMNMMQKMIDDHADHEHEDSFEALDGMTPERMREIMQAMTEVGIAVPPLSSHRGRVLFVDKGCVVCHAVNGVGGIMGPSFDAADMPSPMNAFEFAARMWRGAPAMAQLQEDLMGDIITLTGQELADIVAFAHDPEEQRELTLDDVPPEFRAMIEE